jgi:CDP-diacylglycerol--serine O-phosphatidyltransferase
MLTPDPKYPELRRRRFRPIPVRMLVPNVITLLAICAGLTAIRLSIEGRMELAVAAIVFAAVLDGVDGRVARMIKGQSKFGAELDSLADFVNFGVAPGLMLYFWQLHELKQWRLDRGHGVCDRGGLRLRASTQYRRSEQACFAANYFTGVRRRPCHPCDAAVLSAIVLGGPRSPGNADRGYTLLTRSLNGVAPCRYFPARRCDAGAAGNGAAVFVSVVFFIAL